MPDTHILRLRGVEKSYGYTQVLQGLDMEVPRGKVYGFLGRNGSGKSTTLRALMGLHGFDSGTLEIFGEVVTRPGVRHKRRIGYVSQEQHMYPWMTARSLGRFVGGLYPTWDDDRFFNLIHRFNVALDQRVEELSGGTQVKLALCLALAPSPDLLVLDEPTAGLDPIARRELLDLVREQATQEGRTTIFSGHVTSEIERVADVVGLLDEGQLRFEGPLSLLLDSLRDAPLPLPDLPEGVAVLARRPQDGMVTLQADPALWETLRGVELSPLSLDDAFLAYSLYRTRQ